MIAEKFPGLAELPKQDKRQLIGELCAELSPADGESPDPRIVEILQRRWEEHDADPSGSLTLEEFRKRVLEQ